MTWPAICVESSSSLDARRALAAEAGVHYLPMLEHHRLTGVTCLCDPARVAQIGSLGPETPSEAAAILMLRRGLHGLPVTLDGRVLGFLTLGDLVRAQVVKASERPPRRSPCRFD